MMNRSYYHLLLSRGRKAGLTTHELNSALSARPLLGEEVQPGQTDCNGFICGIDARGIRTIRPAGEVPRS